MHANGAFAKWLTWYAHGQSTRATSSTTLKTTTPMTPRPPNDPPPPPSTNDSNRPPPVPQPANSKGPECPPQRATSAYHRAQQQQYAPYTQQQPLSPVQVSAQAYQSQQGCDRDHPQERPFTFPSASQPNPSSASQSHPPCAS